MDTRSFPALALITVLAAGTASADIIMTKDGRELQGIVVEEYRDRILFSTVEGEASIMKTDIKELFYDDEEANLVKLGEQAMDRRKYLKAVGYYGRALKINPNNKTARDSLVLLQRYLTDRISSLAGTEMKRMGDVDRFGSSIASEEDAASELRKAQERLARSLGMLLANDGKLPIVSAVRSESPAADAGILKGDAIAAVWGRLTGYMSLKEVIDYIMDKASPEIRCTIERTVRVPVKGGVNAFSGPNELIDASLSMELDGLTVARTKEGGSAQEAGIKPGDLVVSIDGSSTRYMPFKKAVEMIRAVRGAIALTVRRDTIIWRKDQ